MSTNYVLFIHGTNVRDEAYAQDLITLISQAIPIEPLVVYWGDLSEPEEEKLRVGYEASDIWEQVWFRDLREQFLLQFVGDAALYLSRYIGADVTARVAGQLAKLKNSTAGDRLHLVTHSLGTIILFDLLFSSRWDNEGMRGHEDVMAVRDAIYGVTGNDPNPKQGIRLGSITTMGSPIGIFSLMDVNLPAVDAKIDPRKASSTHDITPSLVQLLPLLHQELGENKLPWLNFVHPGDPIASPLKGIVPNMVDASGQYIDLQDILVPANLTEVIAEVFKGSPLSTALPDLLSEPLGQTPFAILDTVNAHNSYWQSPDVKEAIAKVIRGGS